MAGKDMDQIFNTTITIESLEMKNGKMTLTAHDRKRYGFWMTKKDGTDSAPYSQFKNMNLGQGDSVFIGFVIEPYTDSRGVSRESNKIINFRETNEAPSQTSERQESPRGGPNFASGGLPGGNGQPPKDDSFWDKKAYKQCLWGYFLNFAASKPLTQSEIDLVWQVFNQIEQDAEKRFSPSKLRQAVQRHAPAVTDMPTINVGDEDMPVEGIPF